jgi:hypothetical protein
MTRQLSKAKKLAAQGEYELVHRKGERKRKDRMENRRQLEEMEKRG